MFALLLTRLVYGCACGGVQFGVLDVCITTQTECEIKRNDCAQAFKKKFNNFQPKTAYMVHDI